MIVRQKNDRFLRALAREPVDVTPVWVMRQAGRYLPEYRQTRKRAGNFMALCKTPELACEVTLQPLARFALDAAILFSDILTIPDAMGLGLEFADGEGPVFRYPVQNALAIRRLNVPDPEQELRYVLDAVRMISEELDGRLPLIGFSGSPWTLATYMVEGGSSKDFSIIKSLLYSQPETLQRLLTILSESVFSYLKAQIMAGVQAVMIFDTWGGVLSPDSYRHYSLEPMHRIIEQLRHHPESAEVPIIMFTKGGGAWLEAMAETDCDALGIDWTVRLDEARQRVGSRVALQGNLDPSVLFAQPAKIRVAVAEVLAQFGKGNGHIFNLGHGIHKGVDPDHVSVMVDAVHELSQAYHAT